MRCVSQQILQPSFTAMNLYFDSEFTGLHQSSTLISLGFTADDNREFYAEFNDFNLDQCDPWINDNVLKHTRWIKNRDAKPGCWQQDFQALCYGDTALVRESLSLWLDSFDKVEIWADCLAYDWVLFCELFGGAFCIPERIFYMPFDLVTLLKLKGLDPDLDRESFAGLRSDNQQNHRHNALFDARLLKACYHKAWLM
ncbi:MAG: 3'-5' exoribonuclease [Acidobacteria bacterium]|nr:3'-5' exoribonuclease [Acidobacteriota bacterium]